jgi:parallel beta-helix repeat protein
MRVSCFRSVRSIRASVVVMLAFGVLLASAQDAAATHVACGDVITTNTTLDSDLVNCPGDGIVIGAAGITLDSNGHLIDGVGSGAGVNDEAGYDGITVMNGRIQEFATGVRLTFVDDSVLSGLTVAPADSFNLDRSDRNLISRNAVEGTIGVFNDSDANIIDRNTAGAVQIAGTFVAQADRNWIEHNAVSAGSEGIGVANASETSIERNAISGGQLGISVGEASSGTSLVQNSVSGSGTGIAIADTNQTLLLRNDVSDSTGDGISVGSASFSTTLDRNTATGNGDDGIDVDQAVTFLSGNTADYNFDLGIEAVATVADGGGNKAKGNGNPAQCLNVVCK